MSVNLTSASSTLSALLSSKSISINSDMGFGALSASPMSGSFVINSPMITIGMAGTQSVTSVKTLVSNIASTAAQNTSTTSTNSVINSSTPTLQNVSSNGIVNSPASNTVTNLSYTNSTLSVNTIAVGYNSAATGNTLTESITTLLASTTASSTITSSSANIGNFYLQQLLGTNSNMSTGNILPSMVGEVTSNTSATAVNLNKTIIPSPADGISSGPLDYSFVVNYPTYTSTLLSVNSNVILNSISQSSMNNLSGVSSILSIGSLYAGYNSALALPPILTTLNSILASSTLNQLGNSAVLSIPNKLVVSYSAIPQSYTIGTTLGIYSTSENDAASGVLGHVTNSSVTDLTPSPVINISGVSNTTNIGYLTPSMSISMIEVSSNTSITPYALFATTPTGKYSIAARTRNYTALN